MATIQNINVSNPNDGNGDTLRDSQIKSNQNFAELNSKKVEAVAGKELSDNNFTDADKAVLDSIENNAQVNVQSDWLQEDDQADDFIKNKPISDFVSAVGTFHYADLATQTVPLVILPNTAKKLENDTLGTYTIISNAPFGVSSLWNPTTNQLDFSQLTIGDILTLRIDAELTTTVANQINKAYITFGIGSAFEYNLIAAQNQVKTAGVYPFIAEVNFDLAYQEIIDNPAEIYLFSDDDATIKINGLYIEILRKNINVIDIVNNIDNTIIENSPNAVSGGAVFDAFAAIESVNYTVLVYFNFTNPNSVSATIFDDVNPPTTNDNALKSDANNLYIGTDASTWVWNGSVYITKSAPRDTSNFWIGNTSLDAGANKVSTISRNGKIKTTGFIKDGGTGLEVLVDDGTTIPISSLGSGTIDATPTDGSTNAVSSNGVFDALALKVDKVAGERLINAAEITKLSNTSNTNTGDETTETIKTKLGITTLSGSNTGDQDLSGLQPKGVRITNATTTGSYSVDWNAGDVWDLTLTGATTITDTNLPSGTNTKVIEFLVTGSFGLTLPAYWTALPSSQAYDGAKLNHIVVSCINGTTSSEKIYYSNETTT